MFLAASPYRVALEISALRKGGAEVESFMHLLSSNFSPPPTTFAVYGQSLKVKLRSFPEMEPFVTSNSVEKTADDWPWPPSVT